jgi:arylsulfatase A-like enzyme
MTDLQIYPNGPPPTPVNGTAVEPCPAGPEPPRTPAAAPNVIFFVLDDVGYGQLSSFGGLVQTPNLDRLAAHGLRYTNMHTTGLCSPSRGSLLTGHNHHALGLAATIETTTGGPDLLNLDQGMLSEMLVQQGYNTFCVGKWHLVPPAHRTPAGPYDRWPLGRGFERYYGFLGGNTNQWYPELIYDNHAVEQPAQPEKGYHLNGDLADRAIQFIQDAHVNAPDQPFFLYYAPGASHTPHQVPKEWANKYRGRFDLGWDEYRQIVHQRQLDQGLIPAGTELSPRDPDVPLWESLAADEQRLYARMMEVYAGFLEHTDDQFGRILSFLEEIDELENTLIVALSDNGTSGAGGVTGAVNQMLAFNNAEESLAENLNALDRLGGVDCFNHYPQGWAYAGNTPFRRWKGEAYRGGTTVPCIVFWPRGIQARGEVRSQYAHIIDLVPTVLEAIGLETPQTLRGIPQAPLDGVSFAHTFSQAEAPSRRPTQYFELNGHRAIYHEGWRAVCPWIESNQTGARPENYDCNLSVASVVQEDIAAHRWELYRIAEDYAECHDLAAEDPATLREMVTYWWTEARQYNVLPAARKGQWSKPDQGSSLLNVGPTGRAKAHRPIVYYPNGAPVPLTTAPRVHNCPFSIIADAVIPRGGAVGVILAQGGRTGGYVMLIKDNKLQFIYNYLGRDRFKLVSIQPVPKGEVTLRYQFEPIGQPDFARGKGVPALSQLYIDETLVGAVQMPHTVPVIFGLEGLTCGYDGGDRVAPDQYPDKFSFTGILKRVTLDFFGELAPSPVANLNIAIPPQ